MTEIKIHKSLEHPNIVKFYHYFEDPENVYVLLELCSSKTLNDLVKKRRTIQEIEAKCYILQLLSAIEYT
jgi:polo-like kinase 1